MRKLLSASVVLALLLCGCQSGGNAPSEPSASVPVSAVESVSVEKSFVDQQPSIEVESTVESVVEPEPLVTVTLPAELGGESSDVINLDKMKENWGFADAVRDEDGTITLTMTQTIKDEYLAFTRESLVGGWFSTITGKQTYAFIDSISYDDESRTASVVLAAGETYDENSLLLLGIYAIFQQQVTTAAEVTGDFSVVVTVYDSEGNPLDSYIADSKKSSSDEMQEKAEAPTQAEAVEEIPAEYSNALNRAGQYLNFTPFSYSGLIGQLEYEGYSTEAATYAADNCGADWNEQAVEKARDYLDYTSFSYDGLVSQLEFEGFTHDQAVYAADQTYQ